MKVLLFTSLIALCTGWTSKSKDYSKCIVGSWEGTIPIRVSSNGTTTNYEVDFILHLRENGTIEFEFDDLLAQIAWYTYYQYEVNLSGAYYKVMPTQNSYAYNIGLYADTDLGDYQSNVVFDFDGCNSVRATYTDDDGDTETLELTRE